MSEAIPIFFSCSCDGFRFAQPILRTGGRATALEPKKACRPPLAHSRLALYFTCSVYLVSEMPCAKRSFRRAHEPGSDQAPSPAAARGGERAQACRQPAQCAPQHRPPNGGRQGARGPQRAPPWSHAADPCWWPMLGALAQAIAGPQADAARRERAMRIALAQVDVLRIRKAKCDILAGGVSPAIIRRLASLSRYERRALARRKAAMRTFDAGFGEVGQDEATGRDFLKRSTGSGHFFGRKRRRHRRPRSRVLVWRRACAQRHWPRRSHGSAKRRSFRRLQRIPDVLSANGGGPPTHFPARHAAYS